MLNEEQAETLFYSNAVLINGEDMVPVSCATDLLGATSVAYSRVIAERAIKEKGESCREQFFTSWNLTDGTGIEFLTQHGFFLVVTYHNIILQAEKENPSKSV